VPVLFGRRSSLLTASTRGFPLGAHGINLLRTNVVQTAVATNKIAKVPAATLRRGIASPELKFSAYGAVLRAAGFAGPPLADRISGFSGINAADFLK